MQQQASRPNARLDAALHIGEGFIEAKVVLGVGILQPGSAMVQAGVQTLLPAEFLAIESNLLNEIDGSPTCVSSIEVCLV
jgi:hypothetical protein